MAKKKKLEDEIVGTSTHDLVNAVNRRIRKDYGEDSAMSGDKYRNRKIMKIPLSPSLDPIIHGGIKEGSFVGFGGHQDTGKTVTALSFAATCQRPEYGSRPIFYGRVESRLDEDHLAGIKGLNLQEPFFTILGSTKQKIWTAQDHIQAWHWVLTSVPGCVLIIDSISSLVDEKEVIKGLGTETRGGTAKVFSQFLDLVKDAVDVNNCIVVGITHLISNTGGGHVKYHEKAARNWAYLCNYRLRADYAPRIMVGAKDKEKEIGLRPHWTCSSASGTGATMGKAVGIIRYGIGVDWTAELISMGVELALIKKPEKSAWYEMAFLVRHYPEMAEKPIKVNGEAGVHRLFQQHPEYLELLKAEMKSFFNPDDSDDEEGDEVIET